MNDLATATRSLCQLCSYQIPSEGLCPKCFDKLYIQIEDLLELWMLAHGELNPSRGGNSGGGSSSEPSLGINVSALNFIAGSDIIGILHEWEKEIRSERGLTPPALLKKGSVAQEVKAAVEFAKTHLEWSSKQPWISDFAKEIKALHSQGMSAARKYVIHSRKIACPADNAQGLQCGQYLPLQDDDLMALFSCKRCGSEWSTFRLIAVAIAHPYAEFWLDAEAIASWLSISERRVHQIVKTNSIAKRGQLIDVKSVIAARKKEF